MAASSPGAGFASEPSLSEHGQRVAYSELARGGRRSPAGRPLQRVVMRNLASGRVWVVSAGAGGDELGGWSGQPQISAYGTRVAFTTDAGTRGGRRPGRPAGARPRARGRDDDRRQPGRAAGLVSDRCRGAAAQRSPLQPRPAGVVTRARAAAAALCAAAVAAALAFAAPTLGVAADEPAAGAAQAPASEPRQALVGAWTYRADPHDVGLRDRWAESPPPMTAVELPNVANAAPLAGSRGRRAYEGSVGWWRGVLAVKPAGHYEVRFGSVHHRATVWIDGRPVCEHTGAYEPFACGAQLDAGLHSVTVRADWRSPAAPAARGL